MTSDSGLLLKADDIAKHLLAIDIDWDLSKGIGLETTKVYRHKSLFASRWWMNQNVDVFSLTIMKAVF